jgi:hypothetical protein
MTLTLTRLSGDYAITRLPADASIPDWADGAGLVSVTRALDELSVVCRAARVPDGLESSKGWTALRVDTLAALDTPGVVRDAVTPVSNAGLGVFVISSHLRDHLLIRTADAARATAALTAAGHDIG